jgi:alpha/beta superfamily hydrolase
MNAQTVKLRVPGPAGALEVALDAPAGVARGCVLICHPHPLGGGTMDNKVVHTLVRGFLQLGVRTVRFNFRGVGQSEGVWSDGVGEIEDALAVYRAQVSSDEPFWLAGFSFGAFVAAQVFHRLDEAQRPHRLVLIGPSTAKQVVPPVPPDTVVIHGEQDEIVPLSATLDWARPQTLPITVLPGVGHFFHGHLALLRTLVVRAVQDSVQAHGRPMDVSGQTA